MYDNIIKSGLDYYKSNQELLIKQTIENAINRCVEELSKSFALDINKKNNEINDLKKANNELKDQIVTLQKDKQSQEEISNYYIKCVNDDEKKLKELSSFQTAALEFFGDLLLYKYDKEDYNVEITTDDLMNKMNMFLNQTLKTKKIKVICSEYEQDKIFDERKHDVVTIQITDKPELSGKIYRTETPGLMYGDYVIKEKVIIWKYEHN